MGSSLLGVLTYMLDNTLAEFERCRVLKAKTRVLKVFWVFGVNNCKWGVCEKHGFEGYDKEKPKWTRGKVSYTG